MRTRLRKVFGFSFNTQSTIRLDEPEQSTVSECNRRTVAGPIIALSSMESERCTSHYSTWTAESHFGCDAIDFQTSDPPSAAASAMRSPQRTIAPKIRNFTSVAVLVFGPNANHECSVRFIACVQGIVDTIVRAIVCAPQVFPRTKCDRVKDSARSQIHNLVCSVCV